MADYRCIRVDQDADGRAQARIESQAADDAPAEGHLLIEVHWSSLNYKDALATTGNPGVVRRMPLTLGIDAVGIVLQSSVPEFQAGQAVLATGYDFGVAHDGGWSERLHAPAEWVLPLPEGLSMREAMIYGTAGFTAGQCVDALLRHGVTAEAGEVVATGATGGVGSLAVAILSHLGYDVTAVTGKQDRSDWLRSLGAARIAPRQEVDDSSDKPLLKSRFAGAVDTVGGNTLATVLRSTKHRGCVTACGLVGGVELPLTVYPFILRGVTLAGIDSALCPMDARRSIWRQLAGPWKPKQLDDMANEVGLDEVLDQATRILDGQIVGRVIVKVR